MKKVIVDQKDESRIEVEFFEHRIKLIWMSDTDDFIGNIYIGKSKATEVAKAIDPNYQKVIDALNTLVQLKDIKGIPEMAEKYGSMKPKAWEQARQILKELNV